MRCCLLGCDPSPNTPLDLATVEMAAGTLLMDDAGSTGSPFGWPAADAPGMTTTDPTAKVGGKMCGQPRRTRSVSSRSVFTVCECERKRLRSSWPHRRWRPTWSAVKWLPYGVRSARQVRLGPRQCRHHYLSGTRCRYSGRLLHRARRMVVPGLSQPSHARCTSPSCAARSQDRVLPPLVSPSRSRASARLDLH